MSDVITITDTVAVAEPVTEVVEVGYIAQTVTSGGTGTPASTVTDETSYGASKAVGTSTNYAREDHTHGSPALGSSGTTAAPGNHNHNAAYDAAGAASGAVTTHTGASDPHGDRAYADTGLASKASTGHAHAGVYDPAGTAAAAVSAHVAAADPHGDRSYTDTAVAAKPSLASTAPGNSAVGDNATTGTGTTAARADHTHGREGFAAVTVQTSYGSSSANGSAATVARSDHTHGTPALTGTAATASAVGDSAAVGTATAPARADHVHGREAFAAPAASAVGDAQAAGSASTVARSDHKHAREAFGNVTALSAFGVGSANGSASTLARSDHVHGSPALATVPATLGSDLSTTSTSLGDVTGMGVTLGVGTYEIEWVMVWQGSVGGGSTVGVGPNIQLVSAGGLTTSGTLRYRFEIQTSASTRSRYFKTAFSVAQAPGSGAQAANNDYEVSIFARITTTVGGTLTPQYAVAAGLGAGTLKIMTGSYVKVQAF